MPYIVDFLKIIPYFTVAEMTLIIKWQTTSLLLVAVSVCMVACDSNPETDEKIGNEADRRAKCEYPK